MRWKNLILMLAAIPALCPLQSCDATKEEALLNDRAMTLCYRSDRNEYVAFSRCLLSSVTFVE